jgi:hypothetical protein
MSESDLGADIVGVVEGATVPHWDARLAATAPAHVRVAVIASGGLSHFVNDEEFDHRIIKMFGEFDYEGLAVVPDSCYQSGTSEIKIYSTVMMALQPSGAELTLVDYIPCWRTAADTGEGMGIMYWDASK